jgi:hypothetical protein
LKNSVHNHDPYAFKNMFNPEETEQGWDVELREDVKSECEGK